MRKRKKRKTAWEHLMGRAEERAGTTNIILSRDARRCDLEEGGEHPRKMASARDE